MDLRRLRQQLMRDIKEICRELNHHPLESFVRAFEKLGIFKRWEELYGDAKAELTQQILTKLKDEPRGKKRAKRFILSIQAMFQGMAKRVWVIASSAQLSDIRRFQAEKLKDLQEQADLFDEWQEEVERRTGLAPKPRLGVQMAALVTEMRQQLGLPGDTNGPALPPPT